MGEEGLALSSLFRFQLMSQYASATDFKELGLPERSLKNVKDEILDRFLTASSGRIDTSLRAHHTLPLTGALGPPNTFPAEVVECAVIIARYKFMIWRGFNPDEFDINFKEAHDACIEWLDKIASGGASLGDVDATPSVIEGAPKTTSNASRGWLDEQNAADDAANSVL